MTDRDFLLTIIENPKEDGPRLVYADYLEETGRCERAEFIRLSIELTKSRGCDPRLHWAPRGTEGYNSLGHREFALECKTCQISRRYDELLRYNWLEWFRVHGEVCLICENTFERNQDGWQKIKWKRGFLSEVSLTESDFLKCAPQLCWHPVEKVTLTDKEPFMGMLGGITEAWNWHSGKVTELKAAICKDLLKFTQPDMPRFYQYFPSKEKAVEALQKACLSYLNSLRTPESCIASGDSPRSGTESTASV